MIWGPGELPRPSGFIRLAGFAWDDVIIIAAFAVGALAALLLADRLPRWRRALTGLVWFAYLWLGLSLLINVFAIRHTGQPVSAQLLAQADWFRGPTPRAAVAGVLDGMTIATLLAGLFALLLVPFLLARILRVVTRWRMGQAAVALGLVGLAGFHAVHDPVRWPTRSMARAVNPTAELIASFGTLSRFDLGAVTPAAALPGEMLPAIPTSPAQSPRLIVLVVLESIGADAAYGESPVKRAGLMPNLARLRGEGVSFGNIYTATPSSTGSGIAIVSGRTPPITEARDLTGVRESTIASVLRARGWQTAFFMTADLSFQNARTYHAANGFAHLQDMTGQGCDSALEFDDRCTADVALRWIAANRDQPAFVVIWSGQAHYPYYAPGYPGSSAQALLRRYEESVRISDAMIGRITEGLRRQGLLESTVLAVTGDHGEAFDEHGLQLHANSVYREETRVPLVLRHPSLPKGEASDRAGSHADIAATLLQLAGINDLPAPGRSLLAAGRERPALSVARSKRPMIGYRLSGETRILYLADGQVEAFDLARDPYEQQPRALAGAERARTLQVLARLARDADAVRPGLAGQAAQ